MEFQTLLQRRTIRQFNQTPLAEADFRALIEAARMASCTANKQRLRYIAVHTKEKTAEILPHTAYAALVAPKRNPVPGVSAPVAFLAVTATEDPSPHLYADAGAAIQSIEFAAWERGIGCCWLGAFNREKVAPLLAVAESGRLLYLVALGFPAELPVSENIDAGGDPRYYLDGQNTLHVPKYTADALLTWI